MRVRIPPGTRQHQPLEENMPWWLWLIVILVFVFGGILIINDDED